MSATAFQRKRREQAMKKQLSENKSDLNEYTVKKLKAMLDEKGIEYDARAKKEELINLLEGAE
jgi:hypothetical protein